MSKKLPHGMTANMMAIAKVEALGRQMGGHYSAGSVTDEARTLVPKAKKKAPRICNCGAEIKIGGRNRKYCDKCLEEKNRKTFLKQNGTEGANYEIEIDDEGEYWFVIPCSKCGNKTRKRKYTKNPVCSECKRLRIRELERKRWHEKKAERARLKKENQDGET